MNMSADNDSNWRDKCKQEYKHKHKNEHKHKYVYKYKHKHYIIKFYFYKNIHTYSWFIAFECTQIIRIKLIKP